MSDDKENGDKQRTISDWILLGEKIGLPVLFTLALMLGIYMVVSWTGDNVVKPLIDSHVKTLTTVQDSLSQQTQIMREFADSIDGIEMQEAEIQRAAMERQRLLQELLKEQQSTNEELRRLQEQLKKHNE